MNLSCIWHCPGPTTNPSDAVCKGGSTLPSPCDCAGGAGSYEPVMVPTTNSPLSSACPAGPRLGWLPNQSVPLGIGQVILGDGSGHLHGWPGLQAWTPVLNLCPARHRLTFLSQWSLRCHSRDEPVAGGRGAKVLLLTCIVPNSVTLPGARQPDLGVIVSPGPHPWPISWGQAPGHPWAGAEVARLFPALCASAPCGTWLPEFHGPSLPGSRS